MKNPNFKVVLLSVGLGSLALHTGYSTTLLEFAGGGSDAAPVTDQVDAYTGMAGGGWAGAWTPGNGSGATTTRTVVDTDPFPSGGNYLQMNYARTSNNSSSRGGVLRQFSNDPGAGGIDMTAAYRVDFDFRIDAANSAQTASSDQFLFSAETIAQDQAFSTNTAWRIWGRADLGWTVFDGSGAGTGSVINLNTSALNSFVTGSVYNFSVLVDPTTNTYDVEIGFQGTTYLASDYNGGDALGFWTDDAAPTFLSFRSTRAFDAVTNQTVDWSLDNIQAVPEPRVMGLLFGAATFGLILLRRRRTAI